MATNTRVIANNFQRRIGKPTTGGDAEAVSGLIERLGDLGLLGQLAEAWTLRAGQNVGSGSTVRGLLGRADMTLTASPTWGDRGITFDGTTQVGTATLPATQTVGTLFVVFASSGTQPTSFAAPAAVVAAAGRATATTGGNLATVFYNTAAPLIFNTYNGTSAVQVSQPSYLYYNTSDTTFQCVSVANESAAVAEGFRVTVDGCTHSTQFASASATSQTLGNACDRIVVAGSWSGSVNQLFFSGTVAFAAVFRTALTAAQQLAVYQAIRATVARGLDWRVPVWIDGDSQAAATNNATSTDRWIHKLLNTSGARWFGKTWTAITNTGIPATGGVTSTTTLANWDSRCPGQRPLSAGEGGWMFLCTGVNDLSSDPSSVETVMSNIDTICKKARAQGFKIGLWTLPAHGTTVVSFQDGIRALNRRLVDYASNTANVNLLVPLHELFPIHSSSMYNDAVHLNPVANTVIADYIFSKVSNPTL